jgi:hypothetical protein
MESHRSMLLRQAREIGAKPCPCCGSPAMATCSIFFARVGGKAGYGSAIGCSNRRCNLHTGISFRAANGLKTALRRWNRRTLAPAPGAQDGGRAEG